MTSERALPVLRLSDQALENPREVFFVSIEEGAEIHQHTVPVDPGEHRRVG